MGIFSGRHFPHDIILWVVRWYCRYGVSYRDLEEMMTEPGVPVDHTTILTAGCRKYSPELDKHTRCYRQVPDWQARSWRVINTDKAPAVAKAISELKAEGICPQTMEHRKVKYLNNVLKGDHGRYKRILGPKGAFKN